MPLPFAFPVGFILGMTLAWMARGELARSEVPLVLARPFLVTLGLTGLVFAPVVGYFVALHGDWSYLYLVRWSRVPSAVDLLLVVLAALQVPLGFGVAAPWAVARQSTRILQVSAALAALVVVVAALFAGRLSVSASFAQIHGGFGGTPIGRSSLGRGMLLSWSALAIAYAWSAHALRSPRER